MDVVHGEPTTRIYPKWTFSPQRRHRAAFTYSRSDQPMGATDLQKGDYYGVHAESSKPLATTWKIISTP